MKDAQDVDAGCRMQDTDYMQNTRNPMYTYTQHAGYNGNTFQEHRKHIRIMGGGGHLIRGTYSNP